MPIRQSGTADHQHFQKVYEKYIRPPLAQLGFEVKRADEIYVGGAITGDIVRRLANADLVIADLTDQNANVFYELGVRHALKSRGTILIVDTLKTPTTPFDISVYRQIRYSSQSEESLSKLSEELARSASQIYVAGSDNPVHDFVATAKQDRTALGVGLIGAEFTGKTHLATQLLEVFPGMELTRDVPRDVIRDGYPLGAGASTECYMMLMLKHLEQLQLRRLSNRPFLSDRTLFDQYVYSKVNRIHHLNVTVPQYVTDAMEKVWELERQYYRFYLYFPVQGFPLPPQGSSERRKIDVEYRLWCDEGFGEVMHDKQVRPHILPIDSKERLEMAQELIKENFYPEQQIV